MKRLMMIAVLAVLAFAPPPALAAQGGELVHIKVLGLVCDFCAQAIEKVFMKTGQVESVKADLDNALITVSMKEGAVFTDDFIREKVTDAGYAIESIHRAPESGHE
jgi:copper chaperone CopZ